MRTSSLVVLAAFTRAAGQNESNEAQSRAAGTCPVSAGAAIVAQQVVGSGGNPLTEVMRESTGDVMATWNRRSGETVLDRLASSAATDEVWGPEETRRALHKLGELRVQDEAPRRGQLEIDAARARYFDLYDFAPVGYWTVSREGLILETNYTAANLLGLTKDVLQWQPLSSLVLPEDRDILHREFDRLLETGAPGSWELRLRGKDSIVVRARMDANVSAHSGERSVVRLVLSNIAERAPTEQQKAQREVQELHLELGRVRSELLAQRKFAEVGRLAGGVAHDFNGLLGTVLAQSELALAGLADGERPEGELQTIREEAVRGSEICRQLMIQAGEESEVCEPVDLSRTITDMTGLIRASVSKHAVMETSLGQDLPAVRAHPAQLRRVVMNLVTNASDALGDRCGAIRVVTKFVTATAHSPGSNRPAGGDYVQLQVSDTGCGMTPEIQARVFDPFFTTKSNGHGIGLTVVQEIVHALGGEIRLASTPGRGSTFEILLPCSKHSEHANGAAGTASEETHQHRPGTILFVEDEELLRQPVSKMLRKAGYSVIEAASGSAAMDRIRACGNEIDVLILDVTLPGASSREVLDETTRLRPEMKVIVSSAFHEDAASASLTRKISHFIRKPYRVDNLLTMICRLRTEAAAMP